MTFFCSAGMSKKWPHKKITHESTNTGYLLLSNRHLKMAEGKSWGHVKISSTVAVLEGHKYVLMGQENNLYLFFLLKSIAVKVVQYHNNYLLTIISIESFFFFG